MSETSVPRLVAASLTAPDRTTGILVHELPGEDVPGAIRLSTPMFSMWQAAYAIELTDLHLLWSQEYDTRPITRGEMQVLSWFYSACEHDQVQAPSPRFSPTPLTVRAGEDAVAAALRSYHANRDADSNSRTAIPNGEARVRAINAFFNGIFAASRDDESPNGVVTVDDLPEDVIPTDLEEQMNQNTVWEDAERTERMHGAFPVGKLSVPDDAPCCPRHDRQLARDERHESTLDQDCPLWYCEACRRYWHPLDLDRDADVSNRYYQHGVPEAGELTDAATSDCPIHGCWLKHDTGRRGSIFPDLYCPVGQRYWYQGI